MATESQIEANRANAQKSTGPTTPEGKAAVRLNGLKHGLTAETIVLPGEDSAEFQALLDDYIAEYQPSTPTDEYLVRRLVLADWRLARLDRLEHSFFTFRHKREMDPRLKYQDFTADERLAYQFYYDCGKQSVMFNFHRYEMRLERSAKIAREELRRRLEAGRANQTQSVQPKEKASPKIINIETVERPPAPPITTSEPPRSAPPATGTEVPAA